jgi:hypothetical protein
MAACGGGVSTEPAAPAATTSATHGAALSPVAPAQRTQVALGTSKSTPPAVTAALVPLGTKSRAADLGPATGVLVAPPLSLLLQPLPRAPGTGPRRVLLRRHEEPQATLGHQSPRHRW